MSTQNLPEPQPALPPGSTPPAIHEMTQDQDARTIAAVAHGTILLNLFMPGLGVLAAGAVWLTQRQQSVYAAKQALQAALYQLGLLLFPIVVGIIGLLLGLMSLFFSALSNSGAGFAVMMLVFLASIPFMIIVYFVGLLYALVGAYESYHGHDFRYWLLGNWVMK